MTPLLGYAVLPWEMEGGFNGASIARGFREIKDAGFDGVEVLSGTTLSSDYARRNMQFVEWPAPPEVRSDTSFLGRMATIIRESERLGLQLANIFCDGEYINPWTQRDELDQVLVIARLARTCGANHLLVTGGPRRAKQQRECDLRRIADVLSELGRTTADIGVQLCMHPHVDTAVEDPHDIEMFFSLADSDSVAFGFDTAHVTAGGGDAVTLLGQYIDRVEYVHFKDIRMPETVDAEFAGPKRFDAFCDLGAGSVDFRRVWDLLRGRCYKGPIIVELDSTPDPGKSARIARRYLADTLGL